VAVQFGIAFQSNKRPAEYVALARTVDRYGFDVVSVYNDLLYQPALGALLFMAPHIHRARLGPAALNPFTLHPLEIAGQIAVLDMATQGRAYLGLVRGAWLSTLGIDTSRSVRRLHEAVLLVRHLLAGRSDGFSGEVFHLAASATLQYSPLRSAVPLTIGTWGLRTSRLAETVADEIKIGGSANPALVGHVRAAAPSIPLCFGAVTVIDDDRLAARRRAREELRLYLPVVARLDPTVEDPEWLAHLPPEELPDELLDRFAFAGDTASIIRQVERLFDAGAARVEFGTPHGVSDPCSAIELLGERVLPHFRP
jgi:5,10-methylenetetrahydromethanopterin reductase